MEHWCREESEKCAADTTVIYRFCRHWILNAVPAIGTHTAVRFLKEKFLTGELSIAEAAEALLASMHMVTADLEAIKLVEASQFSWAFAMMQEWATGLHLSLLLLPRDWLWTRRSRKTQFCVKLSCWVMAPWLRNTVQRTQLAQLSWWRYVLYHFYMCYMAKVQL